MGVWKFNSSITSNSSNLVWSGVVVEVESVDSVDSVEIVEFEAEGGG